MQKKNRIFMRVVAMLLCIVIITTCLVSSIFARYVARDSAKVDGVKLKRWGITIETGSHAANTYTDKSGNTVVATKDSIGSANAIAPGMSGSLAWFHVFGSPEVKYKINFDGNISIGDGYNDAVVNSNEEPLAYFPIVLYLVAYDVTYEGDKMHLERTKSTNAKGKVMDFVQSHLRKEGDVRNTLASTKVSDSGNVLSWQPVSSIEDTFNGYNTPFDYMSLDNCFDQYDLSGSIDRVYALEWCWPYNDDDSYPGSDEPNFKQGRYLYPEYDTQLGEKMRERKGTDDFNISLEMRVTVEQSNETFTEENGIDIVRLGSYPQSLVDDTTLEAKLNEKAEGLTWASYPIRRSSYNENTENIEFVDVKYDGDKYRVIKKVDKDGNLTGGPYWFKYEPIEWIVLEEEGGKAFLLSKTLLDMRIYNDTAYLSGGAITAPGLPANTYVGLWEYSTIRKWLNETFYQTAFNNSQGSMLLVTEVNNKTETLRNPNTNKYGSDVETQDKVFLLSYQEFNETYCDKLKTLFVKEGTICSNSHNDYTSKICANNDYRSATRSPYNNIYSISTIGYYKVSSYSNWNCDQPRIETVAVGIRPAMWVELN